jgi:hypothetical protein
MMIKHCEENPITWPKTVKITMMGYNTAINSTTKHSPHFLMFGRTFNSFESFTEREAIENRLV